MSKNRAMMMRMFTNIPTLFLEELSTRTETRINMFDAGGDNRDEGYYVESTSSPPRDMVEHGLMESNSNPNVPPAMLNSSTTNDRNE